MIITIIKIALGALALFVWTGYCYTLGERTANKTYIQRLESLIKQHEGDNIGCEKRTQPAEDTTLQD